MADGTELVTLSNVSEQFGLARNGTIDGENTLVTLSNIKALLETGSIGGGSNSIESLSWADLSNMSKEVSKLGQDAFREKYKNLLWSMKWIKPVNKINSYLKWHPAYLIGLAHDTKSDGSLAGFTFAVGNLYNVTNYSNVNDAYYTGWATGTLRDLFTSTNMTRYFSPVYSYIVQVVKNNYPGKQSTDRLFPISSNEFGITAEEMKDYDNNFSSTTASKTTYPTNTGYTYEAFDPAYSSQNEAYGRLFTYFLSMLSGIPTSDSYQYGIESRDSAYYVRDPYSKSYKRLRYFPNILGSTSSTFTKPIFYTENAASNQSYMSTIAFCI